MSVEFRLGRNDHKVAEDFLAKRPTGVSAIVLDTKAARHQEQAAEAARDAGADVYFDPATERLTGPGFDLPALEYNPPEPYDTDRLAGDAEARARLVEQVAAAHPTYVTKLTPPHFFVADQRIALLNLDLAERMLRDHGAKPLRASLVLSSRYPLASVAELAIEYARAGIRHLELRISPLGGEDESVRKISKAFNCVTAFCAAGLTVTLGRSGNIGQCAVALGHATHYSVGVGMLEKVNYAGQMSRQKAPPRGDDKGGGPSAGIYLPGLALTVPAKVGRAYLENTDLRTRVGCRLGSCGSSVQGPASDPRGHYLHARAHEASQLDARPAPWRATLEMDRLRRALELRQLINSAYRPDGNRPIETRTLRSLIDDIETERARESA